MKSKIRTNYFPEFSAMLFGRTKPSMVTVNLTNKCNQRCVYCEIGKEISSTSKDELKVDDLKWIIDEMAKNKINRLSLCGGEPFLFEGILEVVNYANTKNIKCTITTNGMTVFKLSEVDLNVLKNCETLINISIDSFDENIETLTRGTSYALSNALKSIEKLHEKQILVTVLTAISKYNYHELSKFLIQAHKIGIKQVLFQPIIYFSNYPDRKTIDEKTQLNVKVENFDVLNLELKKILKFEKKHNINTNVYRILPWIEHYLKTAENKNGKWFFESVLRKFYCRDLYAIIDIAYDGGIQPCGLALAKINIHENRNLGLINLWSNATQGIKNELDNGKYRPICNGCCHHFSRNMLASIMKYPIKNRVAAVKMSKLLISRILSRFYQDFIKNYL